MESPRLVLSRTAAPLPSSTSELPLSFLPFSPANRLTLLAHCSLHLLSFAMLLYRLHFPAAVLIYLLVVVLETLSTALNLFDLPTKRYTPLPHQSAAIQAIKATKASRAQLVLPGGSGKTLIGNHLAREALSASAGGAVVVFLPTLTLLEQTVRSFYQDDPLCLSRTWRSPRILSTSVCLSGRRATVLV